MMVIAENKRQIKLDIEMCLLTAVSYRNMQWPFLNYEFETIMENIAVYWYQDQRCLLKKYLFRCFVSTFSIDEKLQ